MARILWISKIPHTTWRAYSASVGCERKELVWDRWNWCYKWNEKWTVLQRMKSEKRQNRRGQREKTSSMKTEATGGDEVPSIPSVPFSLSRLCRRFQDNASVVLRVCLRWWYSPFSSFFWIQSTSSIFRKNPPFGVDRMLNVLKASRQGRPGDGWPDVFEKHIDASKPSSPGLWMSRLQIVAPSTQYYLPSASLWGL